MGNRKISLLTSPMELLVNGKALRLQAGNLQLPSLPTRKLQ